MRAKKYDGMKVDLSLFPLYSLVQTCLAFMLGQVKYGRYNYQNGHRASQLSAAARRHIEKWFYLRQQADEESGAHELGHAIACLSMLMEQERLGTLVDDRPERTNEVSLKVPEGFEERYTKEYWESKQVEFQRVPLPRVGGKL